MDEQCNHEYCHESTHYSRKESGYRVSRFTRMDVYYCRKCLDKKDVERSERADNEDVPIWWKH